MHDEVDRSNLALLLTLIIQFCTYLNKQGKQARLWLRISKENRIGFG